MDYKSLAFKHILAGILLGGFLGLVLFFNLPELDLFLLRVTVFSLFGGLITGVVHKFRVKGLVTIVGVIVLLVWFSGPYECTDLGILHSPAENKLTGDISENGFDGFRVMACDKGQYPWYYEDLDGEKLVEFCEEQNKSTEYCSMQAAT